MRQYAPEPAELFELIKHVSYRPDWAFRLVDTTRDWLRDDRGNAIKGLSGGLTLIITVITPDSYNHGDTISVAHYFAVPPATYNIDSWRRWLFEQILLVERHEAMEFFEIDGVKPFAPNHGPGEDPYRITELTTETARATSFRGVINP